MAEPAITSGSVSGQNTYWTAPIPSDKISTTNVASTADWNFVRVSRSYEPFLSMWGNTCSRIVTKLVNRANAGKKIRWYHQKLFDFSYEQYDKYGDYYRIIDNSFGSIEDDVIREVI